MPAADEGAAAGERAYFRLPSATWNDLWPIAGERLLKLRDVITRLAEKRDSDSSVSSPAELALELGAMARLILDALAPEESDLRGIITTLRTALALCWDMYSYQEADRVTVRAHMEKLQQQIEGFEADLSAVQATNESDDAVSSS